MTRILVDCHLCNLVQMRRSVHLYLILAFSVIPNAASRVPLALLVDRQRFAFECPNLHIAILADGFFNICLNFVVPLLRVLAEHQLPIRLDHRPVAFVLPDGIFHLRLLSARDLPFYGRGLSEQLNGRILAAHALFPRSGFKNGLPERFPRPDQRLVVFCRRAACLLGFASG